jgi:DNA-3-methyladenine glycosylase
MDSASTTALRDLLVSHAPEVAPRLLGWRLTATSAEGRVSVEVTEVEAYDGAADPASHAFRGRTPRNAVMFGLPGHLYVYFSYGMHWCANVVCGPQGEASAVLLRAGRVIDGEVLAQVRRGPHVRTRGLARGPANLTKALGIAAADNGADLLTGPRLRLSPPPEDASPAQVSTGSRVGVSVAADVPWRFWVTGDDTVSAYRRSSRTAAT